MKFIVKSTYSRTIEAKNYLEAIDKFREEEKESENYAKDIVERYFSNLTAEQV